MSSDAPAEKPRFQIVTSRGFVDWLAETGLSLAFTTYQRGGLIFFGRRADGELGLWASSFDRAMGLCASGDGLWLATTFLLWRLENSLAPGAVQDGFDRVYVPRAAHTTGDLDIHDLATDADGQPVFINTRFNCLATVDPRCSFRPLWRPPFISSLTPEDRCHLNGLTLEAGRPKYVTLVARSDVADGWRDFRDSGGLVLDVSTNEVVAQGLSMPHSPRLHQGQLWLLESGTGHLGSIDLARGRFEPLAFLPGYARGLALVGNHAVVGLSRPRREHSFQGLALDRNLAEKGATARCGLQVIDLERGATVHWARIESGIDELYDVVILPGVVRPKALSFTTDIIGHQFCFVEEGKWQHWSAAPGPVGQASTTATRSGARLATGLASATRELPAESIEALMQRANALASHFQLDEAMAVYRQVLAHVPDHLDGLLGLGWALVEKGDVRGAIHCLRQALQQQPRSPLISYNLAAVYDRIGRRKEALAGFRRAVKLRPDFLQAWHRLAVLRQGECDWTHRTEDHQRIVTLLKDRLAQNDRDLIDPWSLVTLPLSPSEQLALARAYSKPGQAPAANPRSTRQDRLRIGYLSHEFRHGALTQLMAGMFACHDRQRFEVFGYADTADDQSERRRRVEAGCDHFVSLRSLSVVEAARRIAADQLDILVALNLYTTDGRPEIVALRPAPIQVSYMLYATSGADFLDYFLTDPIASPPGAEAHFSEKLVYLPPSYLVADRQMAIAEHTPSRAECCLPEQGFVFCCFNNPYKIDPGIFDVWMRILASVPGSVLWLFARVPEVRDNLRREAQARGIAPERLVFAEKAAHPEHLARHRQADLFLDTTLVNAHTTAVDALWAGLPVLTCPGEHFAQRVGASLLTAAGLPELITSDLASYERQAIHLAQHPEDLRSLRERLALSKEGGPLFAPERFVRPLEQAYLLMAQRHHQGETPAAISVASTPTPPGGNS